MFPRLELKSFRLISYKLSRPAFTSYKHSQMNKRLYAECGNELLTVRVANNFTKIINTPTNSNNLQHPLSNCFKRTTLQ